MSNTWSPIPTGPAPGPRGPRQAFGQQTSVGSAWNGAGLTRPAPVSKPAKTRENPAGTGSMTTSTVLAWWRIVLVVICLAAAVVAPLALSNNRQAVQSVNAATQQMLRLENVRSELLTAEASATQAVLLAAEGAAPDTGYLDSLDSAAADLIDVAQSDNQDRGALQNISIQLTKYSGLLAVAMNTGSQQDMQRASDQLTLQVIPSLDQQISRQTDILENQGGNQQWLIAVLAVPVVLLLVASIVIARRTRRVLNLGLVLALLGAVASWGMVTQLVTTSAASISAVQTSGVSQATAVAQAYGGVTEAKAIEGRMLLGITDQADGAQAYTTATDQASQAIGELGNSDASDQIGQLISTHEQLMAATDRPSDDLVASAQAPYDWLTEWLAGQSDSIGTEVSSDLSDHAASVGRLAVVVGLVMVVAAVSSATGLSGSLRRYR
ncbi:hypothetical protein [Propionimicrobium sp. PCR01-08-3]|uniref:hypothetical protein n=1 Tax=Propionimicrobium sp. PCR01-08-3 TaxID=3052086 RepID=UPI00255CBAAF|nr:hypothetical protein [Propionimicrobium sp. PCR01-08-3]WIY81975.1 hypothetical protein QQ658_10675 [Propionimicrobium sp. PCR01-08-3]